MLDRRSLLAAGGLGLVTSRSLADPGRKPAVRAAHVTDIHITGEKDAPKGVAALFAHMKARPGGPPELVLNTGDTVMAADGKSGARAVEQIDLWKEAVKASPAPVRSCLGNHDVWTGKDPTPAAPAAKSGFGLLTDALQMPAPYYSFDHGGWHFVALNSVSNWPNYGALSAEQFAWLKVDLAKHPRPTVVLSHLPILSVTSLVYGDSCRRGNDNLVPGVWQHADAWAITEVFRRHPQVKLCLSGHMHTQDRCEYRGVTYVCGGAVSGAWWNGSEYGFAPCYGAVDLFADGTFDYRFVDYGWPARAWSGKQLAL